MKFESMSSPKENLFLRIFSSLAASLIWKENRSRELQYLFETLSNLQTISIIRFGLSLCSLPSVNGILSTSIESITEFFSVIKAFQPSSESGAPIEIILIIIGSYFCLMTSIFAFGCYKCYRNTKTSKLLHSSCTYFAQFHHTLAFWVLNVFLMSRLNNYMFDMNNPKIGVCFSSILMILMNYLFGFLGAMFCYDPFLSNNAFSSYNSTFQTLTFFYKALVGPILIFVGDLETKKWVFVIISLTMAFWRQEILFFEMPYYKFSTLKFISLMATSGFAIAITNIIASTLSEYDLINSFDMLYIEIIAVVIISKVTMIRLNNLIFKYSSLLEKNISSSRGVCKRIVAVKDLCRKIKFLADAESNRVCNQESLFMVGKMLAHQTNGCPSDICICNYLCRSGQSRREFNGIFDINKISSQSRINLVLNVLSRAMKSIHRNNKFKILMAHILLKEQGKFCAALLTLFSVNTMQKTLEEKILAFYVVQQLEEEIDKFFQTSGSTGGNDEKKLNIKRIVDFEKKSNQLFTLIKKNTQTYMHLWDSFLDSNASLHEFFTQSIKAEKEAGEIEAIFNTNFIKQKHLSLCICLYVTYLTVVRNQPSKAEKTIRNYHILQPNHENMIGRIRLDGSGDVIIYVSVARERLGRTLHASRSVLREFGWNQAELINQNIRMIQPQFLKERHDQILITHIEKPKNQPDQSILTSFALKKEGYSVPVHINVTIFPYIQNEPIYASLIRRKPIDNDFLVLDPKGTVEAFSEGIGKNLTLSVDRKININQICPDFQYIGLPNKETHPAKELEKLVFQNYIHQSGPKWTKKLSYKAKLESHFILDQYFIYLYLTEKKAMIKDRAIADIQQFVQEELQITQIKRSEVSNSNNDLRKMLALTLTKEKSQLTKLSQIEAEGVLDYKGIITVEETDRSDKIEVPDCLNSDVRMLNNQLTTARNKNDTREFDRENLRSTSKDGAISSRDRTNVNEKIEQAMYIVSKEKYIKLLNYLITFFALLCAGLMGFHVRTNTSELASVIKKVELTTLYYKTTFTLIEANENVRLIDLITRGYISDTLFPETQIPGKISNLQTSLVLKLNAIDQYSLQILELFNLLDEKSQFAITKDRIRIEKSDSVIQNQSVSSFGALVELENSINAIIHLSNIIKNQADMNFILSNTLNDPLLEGDRIISIIIAEYKENFSQIKTKTLALLPLIISSGTFILILLLIDIRLYVKRRDQFIEILLKIDQIILRNHLDIVKRLGHSLQNDVFESRLYPETKSKLARSIKAIQPRSKNNIKFFKNTKRLNLDMIQGVLFTVITILGFTSAFFVLNLRSNHNLDNLSQKVDRLVETYRLHSIFDLFDVALVEYISENNSTQIRSKPIAIVIEEISDIALSLPRHLERVLVDKTQKESDIILQQLLLGDICQVLSLGEQPSYSCKNMTQATGTKGLLTITNFIISSSRESRILYDMSHRTFEASVAALNTRNKMLSYKIAPLFTEGLALLKEILMEDVRNSVDINRMEIIIITILYGFFYLIIIVFLSHFVWKKMKAERNNWRKSIRHVPLSVILSDKPLKTYIIRNCNNIFDSFRNTI